MIVRELMVAGQFASIVCEGKNGDLHKINGRMGVTKYGIVKPKKKTDLVVWIRKGSIRFDTPVCVSPGMPVKFIGKGVKVERNYLSEYTKDIL